jgi:hypothetical protein
MEALLRRFLGQVSGVPVVILPLPTYHFFLSDREPSYLERFQTLEDRRNGRFVIDVLPAFLELEDRLRERCVFALSDPHYTTLAHQVVAKHAAEHIRALFPELVGAAGS